MVPRIIIFFLLISTNVFAGMIQRNVWYVRPVTAEYGSEDGTSFANAFDGFAGINWASIQPNDYLYVCGNFSNEVLTVGKSGTIGNPIYIKGYNGYASIDGVSSQASGIVIDDKNYIIVSDIYIKNQTSDGALTKGTSNNIIIKRVIAEYSGNQSFQNLETSEAKYYNIQGNYSTDDGFSMHDQCIDTIYGGSFYGNTQGINSVGTSTLYMKNILSIANSQYALFPTDTNYYYCYDCTLTGGTTTVITTGDSRCYLYRSTISGGSTNTIRTITRSYLYADSCTISTSDELISLEGTADMKLERSVLSGATNRLIDIVSINDTSCRLTMNKCLLTGYMYFNEGYIEANYCKFTNTAAQPTMDAYNQSQYNINYCIWTTIPNTKAGLVTRAGTTANIRNSVFYGSGTKQGTGITGIATTNSTNCIFSNLNIGSQRAGGTQTSTNDCYYDNTTNTSGTITISNQVTGNPNFISAGTDFSLNSGSSCENTGADLGATYQYGLQNNSVWTNAINLLNQNSYGAGWEIGAYVFEP